MADMHNSIKTKALEDFISRMQQGTIFYIPAWFIPALVFKFHSIHPVFFWSISVFCILTTFFRLYVCKKAKSDSDTKLNKILAISAVSSSAFLWGIIYAFIISHPDLENSLLGITIITGMILATAACLLCIYKIASQLTQALIISPGMFVIIYQYFFSSGYNQTHIFLGCALTVSVIYLRKASNTIRNDYINATKNQFLAESRAQKMEYISVRDPLTQLKNRLFFDDHLENCWIEAQANNTMISLLMIDLDHFKKINDTHGHLIGDECLRTLAIELKKNLRKEGDHLARFGGEEFILCLQPSTPQRGLLIAERLLKSVSETGVIINKGTIKLTCSIGLTSMTANKSNNTDDLLSRADDALYKAKENGRNQISVN